MNGGKRNKDEHISEGQSNFYGDVIAAVVTLNDPRSIDALMGSITTGGMATRTLASFGKMAIDPVIKKLDHNDSLSRSAVARTLSQMLENADVSKDPVSKSKIKAALMRAGSDIDFSVRMSAIDGLVLLGDGQSIAIVERMAKADPFRADGIPGLEGRYPVRERAAAALKGRNQE